MIIEPLGAEAASPTEEIIVRDLVQQDRQQWEALWRGYLDFYSAEVPPETTELSWRRFHDPDEPVYAIGGFAGEQLLGIAHFIYHRSTWSNGGYCYLNDLFTAKAARKRGVGRKLIERVYERAALAGATRVYWLTHESNQAARSLYEKVADRPGFIQYRKAL